MRTDHSSKVIKLGSSGNSGKESASNSGVMSLIPGPGRSHLSNSCTTSTEPRLESQFCNKKSYFENENYLRKSKTTEINTIL